MEKLKQVEALLVMTVGFVGLHFLFGKEFFLWIAFGIGAAGLFSGFLAKGITWIWFKIADGLGYVNSRILLSLVFFIILLPFALLQRLFRKDLLMLRSPSRTTFVKRNHLYEAKELETPW